MEMRDGRGDSAGYLGWFLFGAALGAAVGYLTAPRSGPETRERLAARGGDVARRAQGLADDAQTQAGEWLDKSRELFEEQTQRLVAAFEAGRDAMREEIRKWSTTGRG
jgi:gas vesicle protein